MITFQKPGKEILKMLKCQKLKNANFQILEKNQCKLFNFQIKIMVMFIKENSKRIYSRAIES